MPHSRLVHLDASSIHRRDKVNYSRRPQSAPMAYEHQRPHQKTHELLPLSFPFLLLDCSSTRTEASNTRRWVPTSARQRTRHPTEDDEITNYEDATVLAVGTGVLETTQTERGKAPTRPKMRLPSTIFMIGCAKTTLPLMQFTCIRTLTWRRISLRIIRTL